MTCGSGSQAESDLFIPDNMAILDLDHLKRIVGDDPAFLRQVLQIFIRNAPVDMKSLAEASDAGDHEQVAFFAHKLKSACGAIGFNSAYEDFKELEAMAKELQDAKAIQDKVNALSQQCLGCMVDIEDIMNGL